jgi:hypothetical protein
MREKSRDFLGFSYDFFLPHTRLNPVKLDLVATLRSPSFENAEAKAGERADRSGLFGVFEDFGAGVVFLFHVYRIPQDGEKASDFFTILQTIFVDTPHFLKKFKQAFDFLVAGG